MSSAEWGKYIKTIHADHLDEIGQLLGSTQSFNHYEFYESIAEMLKEEGL